MWAEKIAERIIARTKPPYTLTTGATPSGPFHLGHLREVLTADIVVWALKKAGKKTRFYFIVDDFDPLRKRYPFLPEKFEDYVGKPLCLIPDPENCHPNYAEHFFAPFRKALKELGIKVKIKKASELYQKGAFAPYIEMALRQKDKIAEILEKIAGTKIEKNFSPFRPLCPQCHRLTSTKVKEVDYARQEVQIECECGFKGKVNYAKGGGKLIWRVHWPAWWMYFNTSAEPFGKDHASEGGSYQTGKAIIEKIFGKKAPLGIPYDLLYLRGAKGKMSSSVGNVIDAFVFSQSLPKEIVKFAILRVLPEKPIFFDPKDALRFSEEISSDLRHQEKLSVEKKKLYQYLFQTSSLKKAKLVPWAHFVLVAQIAKKPSLIKKLLSRSDHRISLSEIKQLLPKVKNWIQWFCPEAKITLAQKPPKLSLTPSQQEFLSLILENWQEKDPPEKIQNLIYQTTKRLNLTPRETFGLIYQILLGKDSGPKAGLLLSIVGKKKFKALISPLLKSVKKNEPAEN